MLKRKAPSSIDEAEKRPERTPCIPEPGYSPPSIRFNALCSVCEATFSRVREDQNTFSCFHSITELITSAAEGCHFCNLITNSMSSSKGSPQLMKENLLTENDPQTTATFKGLKAETRYVADIGISFLLRRSDALDHDVLAEVDLLFGDGADDTGEFTLSGDSQSENSWDQVLQWNRQCLEKHLACKPSSTAIPKSDYPARLICVGDNPSTIVKLFETSKIEVSKSYTTLSHCWGSHIPLRLLTDNYSSLLEGFKLIDLPETFRDAITTTRKLGIPFLWIDSLCIIQDSAVDWSTESSKMGQIYKNSYLNLAAAAAKDSTEGLFFPRSPLQFVPCHVRAGRTGNMRSVRSTYSPEGAGSDEMILYSRAWVFQEWLLAPRTLIFGKNELLWECGELNASEVYPKGYPTLLDSVKGVERLRLATLRNEWQNLYCKDSIERWELWCRVTNDYSKRKLTRFSDKLVALSGFAAEMAKSWEGMDYLAGIWSYRLRRGLLWRCVEPVKLCHRLVCTTPSWSWASTDRPVFTDFEHHFIDGLVEILDASIQHSVPSHRYGAVIDGHIKIKGPMLKATIVERKDDGEWNILLSDDSKENTDGSEHDGSEHDSSEHDGSEYDGSEYDDSEDLDSSLPFTIRATICWDDPTFQKIIKAASVYLVPFEISLLPDDAGLDLQGLILLPTLTNAGQFRRLGWFRVEDKWRGNKHMKRSISLSYDDNSPRDSVPEEVESLDGCLQVPPDKIDGLWPYRTALELKAIWIDINAREAAEREAASYDVRTRKIQEFMVDLTKAANRDGTISQSGQSKKDDFYCNGMMNTTLLERYGDDMRHIYPKIHSFLVMTFIRFNSDREEGKLCEELYEEHHGNGYFTFRIV
ncbi:HET-domain-containing protein [Mytilinidion resinicola]|uniref:HET-domain-containing protein n=1 Tax=Mytilinidion resinicola TaxID=574789 RepID=A0A6A6YC93_9PEZI|nr:HET-domain-containing protein [Mytilinidion resinicola]KAF2806431.1 HET-domain-containing protein [Mytilinidion resinicola]